MREGEWFGSSTAQCMGSMIQSRGDENLVVLCLQFGISLQLFSELAFPFDVDFLSIYVLDVIDALHC